MITRIRGKIVFECDACDEILDTDTDDFPEALRTLRGDDWKSEKVGDDWTHLCPRCHA
jgi:hypothetical protein